MSACLGATLNIADTASPGAHATWSNDSTYEGFSPFIVNPLNEMAMRQIMGSKLTLGVRNQLVISALEKHLDNMSLQKNLAGLAAAAVKFGKCLNDELKCYHVNVTKAITDSSIEQLIQRAFDKTYTEFKNHIDEYHNSGKEYANECKKQRDDVNRAL